MNSPKVSVIIPCYNAQKYLRQCMDSVVSQTLRDIEIICVDDGSSDATLEILGSYAGSDPRVRVLSQANAGAGAARNNGMAHASGEYLSFLDADDFFEPDMLEKAAEAADRYQADYVVYDSDQYHMDTQSFVKVPWVIRTMDLPPYMPFSYRQLTDNVFLSFVGWAWDKLYRRSFVEEKKLYFQEQRTTNDMLFVFSALITAKRIAVVKEVLAHQRRGSSESLSVTRERSWHCFHDALTALRQRLVEEDLYWELERDYINYALHFCLWHLNSLAEPTHTLLLEKLRTEWFAELGIADKPESYFDSREEYAQYASIVKTTAAQKPEDTDAPGPDGEAFPFPVPEDTVYTAPISEPEEAYAECVRFDRIRDEMMADRQVWLRWRYRYWQQKLIAYERVRERLTPALDARFAERMCREFRRAQQLGQLNRACFTPEQWRRVRNLILHSDGAVSVLQSVGILRKLSPYIPDTLKRTVVRVLRSIKRTKG